MKRRKISFPAAYWVSLSLFCLFAALLLGNIFVTDALTGEKDFSLYQPKDWLYFILFLLSELLIGYIMYLFAAKSAKYSAEHNQQMRSYFHALRYSGIHPEEFNFVWFDELGYRRAKIRREGNQFSLGIDFFSRKMQTWQPLEPASTHASLEAVKAYLIENDFFCEETLDNSPPQENGSEPFANDSQKLNKR